MGQREKGDLSFEERVKIEVYISDGLSDNAIGRRLKRAPSTISREIHRNRGGPRRSHYKASHANDLAILKRSIAAAKNPRKAPEVWEYVTDMLKEGWTPEMISGRISIDHPGLHVSHEAIYQYIYSKGFDLTGYLPRRRPMRRKRNGRKAKRSPIPNRLSIDNRPDHINNREQIGHWESDSVVCSTSKISLNVMVERKSRYVQISRINDLTSAETKTAIVSRLASLPQYLRRSITYDNGFENRRHEEINQMLKTTSYFCLPYHSWEKGSVENINGLIRRYIPKKMDLSTVTEEQIRYVENQLNNRPKKCLGYLTPNEVFNNYS
jgi:IS30 family transposase